MQTYEILKNIREKNNLTQDQMAERIGVTRQAISRWETGETYPNAYQLVAVCQVLDIDEDITFFTSAPKMQYLNEQGKKKVREYRDDLIATGRYTPKKLVSIERIRNRKMKKYLAPAADTPFIHQNAIG